MGIQGRDDLIGYITDQHIGHLRLQVISHDSAMAGRLDAADWEQEVAGSNPAIPTIFRYVIQSRSVPRGPGRAGSVGVGAVNIG